jgi:hypothetical protein
VVILIIYIDGIETPETKGNPPVAAHPNSPGATTLTLEFVQVKPREGHIPRRLRGIKPAQDQTNSLRVSGLDAGTCASQEELLKATE